MATGVRVSIQASTNIIMPSYTPPVVRRMTAGSILIVCVCRRPEERHLPEYIRTRLTGSKPWDVFSYKSQSILVFVKGMLNRGM